MLDVSIRIGLLNVMADLRGPRAALILYITRDIASAPLPLRPDRRHVRRPHRRDRAHLEEVLAHRHSRTPTASCPPSPTPRPRRRRGRRQADPPVVIDHPQPPLPHPLPARRRLPATASLPRLQQVGTGHTSRQATAPRTAA
ncbi:hypothetical protein [Streptomyces sp. KL116D]|uniref:hypothetical protein n=1 Tax=Streptomyces sp. KL116D TaxID=3045152 RepID=UPI003557C139